MTEAVQQAARGGTRSAGSLRVAAAFLVTMVGTTLPTPLYPIYQRELGFGPLVVTVVFATYAVGVLAALLVVGRLSDQVGRRAVLLPGLGLAAASSLVFLIPHSLVALFAGRLLSGLSAGVFTAVATAMLVDLAPPEGRPRAGLLAAAVNLLGLGLGPVLAGALADHAPAPLVLPYVVHTVLVGLVTLGMLSVPEPHGRRPGPVRLRVQRLGVPEEVRPVFVPAVTAGFAGFAVNGFFTAVSPLFVGQVLHEPRHLVTGLTVFALLGSGTLGQVASARLPDRVSLLGGCALLAVGTVVVAAGLLAASLALVLAGAVVAGLGQGASFRAGLQAVTGAAPAGQRSEVSATFFLVLYVAISIPVVGVGLGTQVFALVPTAVVFAGVVTLLAVAAFVSLLRRR